MSFSFGFYLQIVITLTYRVYQQTKNKPMTSSFLRYYKERLITIVSAIPENNMIQVQYLFGIQKR